MSDLASIINEITLELASALLATSSSYAQAGLPPSVAIEMVRDAALAAAVAHHRSAAMAGHVVNDDRLIADALAQILALPQQRVDIAADGSLVPASQPN